MERRPITDAERLLSRIEVRKGCWFWTGTFAAGYPVFTSRTGNISIIPLLWKQENGPVPEGHVLTCIHPKAGTDVCVNPAHYRSRPNGYVPISVCKKGHDLTDEANVYRRGSKMLCLPCMVLRKNADPGQKRRRRK